MNEVTSAETPRIERTTSELMAEHCGRGASRSKMK